MDRLIEAGVDRLIVNTHHLPEVYEEKFPDRSWRGATITFRHEPVLLDTGGGLKNIEDLLEDDQSIFCYNGDVFWEPDLLRLARFHEEKKAEVTLALRSTGPLLNVDIDERGEVCDLRHTFGQRGVKSCQFSGVYALETSFLQNLEEGRVESVIPAFLRRIATRPGSIMGVIMDDGSWNDIGTVEEYERLKGDRHEFGR
jgi:NDP-sugar pyrophosphorylase family protein